MEALLRPTLLPRSHPHPTYLNLCLSYRPLPLHGNPCSRYSPLPFSPILKLSSRSGLCTCAASTSRTPSKPRFIQHKQEAFWFYRFLSIIYDNIANLGHWTEDMREDALEPADLNDPNLTVVDVGGGTGFCTQGIVKHVNAKNVTILDQSPHQLAKAREKDDIKECTILEGDAEDLPFATDSVDRYISAGSIEYWPEPQRGIKEAYRVLKKGGKACLIGPVHPTFWLSSFFADVWMAFPTENEYLEWFTKAGFTDVKIKRIGPKWYRGVRKYGLIRGCSVTGVKPEWGDSPLQQGTTMSCATRSTPFNADKMEEIPDNQVDGSASTSSCVIKRPLLTKLMLGLSGCEKPWLVPWTSFTIFQVMFLWFCTFWLVGSWIIPFAAHYAGCSKDTLTYRGQALYSLITDIAEGTVGLGILHRCLARFKPLPRNWFPFSWRGQWYIDVLLGCLTFPVVNRLSQLNLELLPFPSPFTSSYEQSIMTRDPIASVLYAIVVSVCCPIWEEVIFRGFLLPSLTRYLPMWASIFVSALVFGLAHFNVQRMLPLTFLGLIMGIMFVRSRNLLSSMLLHSLWNGFVFMGLLR